MLLHIIKFILVLFSIYLSYKQFKNNHNKPVGSYWLVVATYWFVNLMQGLL